MNNNTVHSPINKHSDRWTALISWWFYFSQQNSGQTFIKDFLQSEQVISRHSVSGFRYVKDHDDDDDDDANSKDVEVVKIGTGETLTMLDSLVNLKYLSKEERNSLVTIKFKLEKTRVLNKKQSYISDYFVLE